VKRLVLWDIDRTLIYVGGVDRLVYREVFTDLVGREPASLPAKGTGLTVPLATRELFVSNGVPEGQLDRLVHLALAEIPVRFASYQDRVLAEGIILPGAAEAVRAVHSLSGTIPTVVTGNLEPSAVLKLKLFGLDGYVDLGVGGYSSDNPHRPALVSVAQRRAAERYAAVFERHNTVIIGDSIEDVRTGGEGGASVIGIASGTVDAATLSDAGADLVLKDLRDAAAVVAAVLKLTT
jgi:phosphoglycolate phosphatase-like HAD superfamily hydrolase